MRAWHRRTALRALAEEHGVNWNVVRARLGAGWSPKKAATTPSRPRQRSTPGKLSWGLFNTKLRKLRTIGFGLPAGLAADGFETCPARGVCASLCFARQGFYLQPWVAAPREENLRIVRSLLDGKEDILPNPWESPHGRCWGSARLGELMKQDLTRLAKLGPRPKHKQRASWENGPRIVRVHDSGDFFSLNYLLTWYAVAVLMPDLTFYAYTKMFHRLAPDIWSRQPNNFRIIQSAGGRDDEHLNPRRPIARIFTSRAAVRKAGYVYGNDDDEPAIRGALRIGLVYHGASRHLQPAERRALEVVP